MWRNWNCHALLEGMQTGAATVENSTEVPQKFKNETTLSSSNHTTENLPKQYKTIISRRYTHPYVYSSIIYNSQTMEIALMSIDR